MVCESHRTYRGVNYISRIIPSSKLTAEMSQLRVPTKGIHKRASSETAGQSVARRMKLAHTPTKQEIADRPKELEVADASEKEMDMSDIMAEIKDISKARLKVEKRAREDGRRVEKRPRLKIRRRCCPCGEMAVVKPDGETICCKHLCLSCLGG